MRTTRKPHQTYGRNPRNLQEIPEHLSSWDIGYDPEQRHEPQHFSAPTSNYIPMPIPDTLLDNVSPDDLDHTPLTFGKYQGKTPDEVSKINPAWLVWAYNTIRNRDVCSKLLADECEKALNTKDQPLFDSRRR